MRMQQDGRLGQNADTPSTDPIQRLAESRERLHITAYSSWRPEPAHVVLRSGRTGYRTRHQPY